MTEVADASTWSPSELLAAGRRHLAVKDFTSAVETLANACELLAKEHGDSADQCAEAYLWYGKALLGLSREESGVLGDGMPGTGNADEEEEDNDEENEDNPEEEQNGEAVAMAKNGEASSSAVEKSEAVSTTTEEPGSSMAKEEPGNSTANEEPGSSTANEEPGSSTANEEPGSSTTNEAEPETTNGDADESMMNVDETAEDDVDNLQLAWEMLDLARSILVRRVQGVQGVQGEHGAAAARAVLADVHLALGEVALESETYDKAVIDMQSCLELQKELYGSDDRRIAETHYQIGLANSLASSFEDAITHFKNAANILESRIKTLESPASSDDATVKKHSTTDPHYSAEAEIKELKELLPEIQEKIQDMMDYKAETIKRVRESLFPSNGEGSSNGASSSAFTSSSSSSKAPQPASDISHLVKRKRKASEGEADSSAKRINT